MAIPQWLLSTSSYGLAIITGYTLGATSDNRIRFGVLVVALCVGGYTRYRRVHRSLVEVREEQIGDFLSELIFPAVINEYSARSADDADIRINVMRFKRRDFVPWGKIRSVLPFRKSLKIDFCHGDYSAAEKELKWLKNEGVCGTAIKQNEEVWTDLNHAGSTQQSWNMQSQQMNSTSHLGSVLSIPIYRPEDDDKKNPVGILNVDSDSDLALSELNDSDIRSMVITYANYVGTLL